MYPNQDSGQLCHRTSALVSPSQFSAGPEEEVNIIRNQKEIRRRWGSKEKQVWRYEHNKKQIRGEKRTSLSSQSNPHYQCGETSSEASLNQCSRPYERHQLVHIVENS